MVIAFGVKSMEGMLATEYPNLFPVLAKEEVGYFREAHESAGVPPAAAKVATLSGKRMKAPCHWSVLNLVDHTIKTRPHPQPFSRKEKEDTTLSSSGG
jgi:hypothetical protein